MLRRKLDDFDRDIINGNGVCDRHKNVVVNEGTVDQEFTVDTSGTNLAANEDLVNVKTLKSSFSEKIDRDMGKIVDTAEERIQNAFFMAIISILTPKLELAIRLINASSGRHSTSLMANSERGEHMVITAPFENVSQKKNTLRVLNMNDETRKNLPDEVSELLVPRTHFDRQPHTHQSMTN